MGISGGRALVVTLVVASVLASGCAKAIEGRAVAGPSLGVADDSECTKVDAPMTTIEPAAGAPDESEPTIRLPQPDGWERVTDLDSALIRFTMRNPSLAAGNFASTAVVTMESHPGELDPDTFFEGGRDALASMVGATDIDFIDSTVCGLQAQTVHYTIPPTGATPPIPAIAVLAVVFTGARTYGVCLTVQSPASDDPVYQGDATVITTGFQVLAPNSGRR